MEFLLATVFPRCSLSPLVKSVTELRRSAPNVPAPVPSLFTLNVSLPAPPVTLVPLNASNVILSSARPPFIVPAASILPVESKVNLPFSALASTVFSFRWSFIFSSVLPSPLTFIVVSLALSAALAFKFITFIAVAVLAVS